MGYCYGLGNYGASFMGGFGWIIPIIFFMLIIYGVYYITKSKGSQSHNSAIETLNHEYAKGNISKEEYLERKENLQ